MAEYELLQSKANSANLTISELLDKIREIENDFERRKETLLDLKSRRELLSNTIDSHNQKLSALDAREAEVTGSLKDVKTKADEAKQSLSSSTSRNQVLRELLKEKEAKRIDGIYGRLGDLGTIPAKYDIAVSTACSALDNIVVDTTETAQKCIEYLRSANLGRATFIALEKLTKPTGKFPTPENIPRLFDLITPREPSFASAFYFALRDTLVAEDLKQANRTAYGNQRFRVVTIDGNLIDRSGAMSGGGSRIQRGGMSSTFSDDLIDEKTVVELEKERDRLSQEIKKIQTLKSETIELLEKSKFEAKQLDFNLTKVEMEYGASEATLKVLKRQLNEIK